MFCTDAGGFSEQVLPGRWLCTLEALRMSAVGGWQKCRMEVESLKKKILQGKCTQVQSEHTQYTSNGRLGARTQTMLMLICTSLAIVIICAKTLS